MSRPSLRWVSLAFLIALVPGLEAAADASYQQDPGPDGLVWIEAADLSGSESGADLAWRVSTDPSGEGRVVLTAGSEGSEEPAEAPRLRYRVIFTKSGTHYLWVRGAGRGHSPSIDVGLDGQALPGGAGIGLSSRSPGWTRDNAGGVPASFAIPLPGEYDLHVWGRDEGTALDRIIVTSNPQWSPRAEEARGGRAAVVPRYTRLDSGEDWEALERVGPHPDLVVELTELGGRFVFWRGSSFRPYWETARGRAWVDEVVPRTGDGAGLRPDRTNLYARADLVESSSARAVVRWRYLPDFERPGLDAWVEEYFTIHPDGLCLRAIRRGTPTLEEWEDPAHTEVQAFRLTSEGIAPVPAPPPRAALSLSSRSADAFVDEGHERTRGSHVLRCREPGRPTTLGLTLDPGGAGPVRNPVIEVREWGDAGAVVSVGGQALPRYEAASVGHLDGADLVLWLELDVESPVEVSVEPVGGSEPVARAPIPDPYGYDIPVLPEGSADPGPFGACFTHLKYFEEWDAPWRVGPHADIVVQFDDHPHRLVFWRGADYVPHWANDQNHWYESEFVERRAGDAGLEGCCAEPMQDHEARYSNARIIASHDARAVVHWRYAPSDRNYDVAYTDETGWGDRVDEYYYVYPDAVSVREATLYTSAPHKFNEWHEAIPLVNPGKIPEDVLEMEAIALTDVRGTKKVYSWQDGFPETLDDGLNIMLIGLRGSTRPFTIVESRGVWIDEISLPNDSRFNHYDDWPGWPASQRRGDWERTPETGYREFWKILPSHSSLTHFMWDDYAQDLEGPVKWKTKIMLHGLTGETDVDAMIPLARSWEAPPALRLQGSGYTGGGYDKAQRAYRVEKISGDPRTFEATLEASVESPLVNAALVIDGWSEGTTARLSLDGQIAPSGPAFRQGLERSPDGGTALVVWIEKQSTSPVTLAISPR